MATDVDITNIALGHLGNKANVVAINPPDNSTEANWASRFFPQAVYRMLEREDWSWARKREALAPVALPAGAVYGFAYTLPSDCLKPRRVLTGDSSQYEDDTEPYTIENGTLLTNKADAVLVYTWPQSEITKWPPAACEALSYELAAYLAGPLLKGNEGVNAGKNLRQIAAAAARDAAAMDGENQARPKFQYTADSLRARGVGGSGRVGDEYVYRNGFTIA